jgi:hypothetical protein
LPVTAKTLPSLPPVEADVEVVTTS